MRTKDKVINVILALTAVAMAVLCVMSIMK